MWWHTRRIYMDFASATPVLSDAAHARDMAEIHFANPGSIHADGVEAKKSLERSREAIASELACKAREVVFVSGGTEANNLAILGFARQYERLNRGLKGTHWIVSEIEHPSVLECFSEVERLGGTVTHLHPDEHGLIKPETLEKALKKDTVFVSIAWSNHEIGVIQPMSRLSAVIRTYDEKHGTHIMLHSDASQTPLYRAPHVHTIDVDLLSLDSGKLHGPRGIGALYISNRAELARVMLGGGQERGLRAGTENVALAAGFAVAFSIVRRDRDSESRRVAELRNMMGVLLLEKFSDAIINGDLDRALPHILNFSIPGIDSEYVTLSLDREGISVATKSACREGEESKSHVVAALGGEDWRAQNTLRISLGRNTTLHDCKRALEVLESCIRLSRKQKMI